MHSGFEVYTMQSPAEVKSYYSVKQDVGAGLPLPVRFVYESDIVCGTSNDQVNVYSLFNKPSDTLNGMYTVLLILCSLLSDIKSYSRKYGYGRCCEWKLHVKC